MMKRIRLQEGNCKENQKYRGKGEVKNNYAYRQTTLEHRVIKILDRKE